MVTVKKGTPKRDGSGGGRRANQRLDGLCVDHDVLQHRIHRENQIRSMLWL